MSLSRPARGAAIASIFVVAACTNPASLDPNSDPSKNTKTGAIAGAIAGVGVGLITGGDNQVKNAAVGAAAGALLGAGVGAALDQQAADLRAQLANDGITVTNTGDKLIVTLPQDITFDVDSFAVRPELQSELAKVAANFNAYQNSNLQVIVNTDNTGEASYNLTLSQQRASSVASVLINDGVSAGRISILGKGEEDPLASNLTPEGRAQNRRVEIVVLPKN